MASDRNEKVLQALVKLILFGDEEDVPKRGEEDGPKMAKDKTSDDSDGNACDTGSGKEATGRCYLLTLPAELRNRIWKLLIHGTTEVECKDLEFFRDDDDKIGEPAITATCRQIRDETLPMFYNTVVLHVRLSNDCFEYSLQEFDPAFCPQFAISYQRAVQIAPLIQHAKAFEFPSASMSADVHRLSRTEEGTSFTIQRDPPQTLCDETRKVIRAKLEKVRRFLEKNSPPPCERFVMTPKKLDVILKTLIKEDWVKDMEDMVLC